MKLPRLFQSLLARIVLFAVLLVIAGSTARYIALSKYLRDEVTDLVSAQQYALAESVAGDVAYQLDIRGKTLQRMADSLPPALLQRPEALRVWLQERHDIYPMFSDGLMVADPQGRVLMDWPQLPGRTGMSVAHYPRFVEVKAGKGLLGRPQHGPISGKPILPMGVAVKGADGQVKAVLIGVTGLTAPHFLDRVRHGRIGKTGSFLLISPPDKVFVAANRPDWMLKATPPTGVNLLHDRAMAGYRGSGVTVNALGVEELSSMASVPGTPWFVVARTPTQEAFSLVRRAQDLVVRHTLTTLLIVLTVVTLMMRFMLGPLYRVAQRADRMTRGEIPLEPLPVFRQDEVGDLTQAFNRLLEKLGSSQAEMQRMAHHDALTGLPNRTLLADRLRIGLARARRHGSEIAVLFFDLDGFKPVNDAYGHKVGDAALVEVARRLSAVMRESDTLARVGGDEFVLLLDEMLEPAEQKAIFVAGRCIEAMRAPFHLGQAECQLGVSIGIAISDGEDDPEQILIRADQAMYEAKALERGCYVIARS